MILLTKFYFNPISGLSEKYAETAQLIRGLEFGGNSVECDKKLIRPRAAPDEFAHQLWAQHNQQFVCKCVETAWQFRVQHTVRIQWSMTKS